MLLSPVGGAGGVKSRGAAAEKETGRGGSSRGGMTGLNATSTGAELRSDPDGQPLRGAAAGCHGAALGGLRTEEPRFSSANARGSDGIVEMHPGGTSVNRVVAAEQPHADGAAGGRGVTTQKPPGDGVARRASDGDSQRRKCERGRGHRRCGRDGEEQRAAALRATTEQLGCPAAVGTSALDECAAHKEVPDGLVQQRRRRQPLRATADRTDALARRGI